MPFFEVAIKSRTNWERNELHLIMDCVEFEADRYAVQPDGSVAFFLDDIFIGGFDAGEHHGIIGPKAVRGIKQPS